MEAVDVGSRPTNALYIVQGEISCIVTEMKRSMRYSSQAIRQGDTPLINSFTDLRETLHSKTVLSELEPSVFLAPFLELVRSEETSGRITGLALTSLNKFIAYGFIDCRKAQGAVAVDGIADAVTHARFVGTDPESDEVVLMKILYVLRTLLLSPSGASLTNESVCEIMQSCFRICFETRLSKLLRRTADHILVEMVQLLFTRLPEFAEDSKWAKNMRKLKMRAGGMQKPRKKVRLSESHTVETEPASNERSADGNEEQPEAQTQEVSEDSRLQATTVDTPSAETAEVAATDATEESAEGADTGKLDKTEDADGESLVSPHMVDIHEGLPAVRHDSQADLNAEDAETSSLSTMGDEEEALDFINPKGVRFIPKKEGPIVPYGLPSIRELFRFLISIMNPSDRQNNDEMSHMGIYLLTIALETAVDHLPKYASLMSLVKDELCFNLFRQLQTDKVSVFSAAMRACFLLFESLRSHLKFQLEMYLSKLMEVIVSESQRVTYDVKEIALQGLVQLWRIPGLVTELYLNYDCDVHCTNLFEDITKLLSKNAFPVTGLFSTHVLSLDALLTVLESVEAHCHSRIMAAKTAEENEKKPGIIIGQWRKPQIKPNRMVDRTADDIPPLEILHARKQQKQVYNQAVEMFNQKPKQGVAFLQEQGYLDKTNESIVTFLKETPRLNKTCIGEYISRKDNPELTDAYMRSFTFVGKRLDEALRMLLESFRLPGESPVIEFLMEHFTSYWFEVNNAPFATSDAAFTLAYAIIMLNVDQHSQTAKKQNIPMTLPEFQKNVKHVNGGKDFDQAMLEEIFTAIHKEEIVLPEERTGLVKEIYSWKVLLGKAMKPDSAFVHAPTGCYDNELFTIIWGPTIAALSFVFDKSQEQAIVQKSITGFRKCAMISAHYGLSEVFDNLVISLCKFTTFLNSAESSEQIPISFAANQKAQLAAKTVFSLAHRHGDMLREGWKNILDCMMTLYRARLLPDTFTEVEDFLHPDGKIKLIKEDKTADPRNDSGVFNSILTYFATDTAAQKGQSVEEEQAKETSKQVIDDCDLDCVIDDTKFLRTSSLQELIKALISLCQISELDGEGSQDEETVVFFLELLIRVVLQNRDRAGSIWQSVRDHLSSIIMRSSDHTFLAERAVTGLLRLAIRLLCREEVACQVLPSLRVLLLMKPTVLRSMSRQLAFGLHLLLETNAANIHSTQDWYCLFTLLEVVGAGGSVPSNPYSSTQDTDAGAQSDGEFGGRKDLETDRGCTSDSELYDNTPISNIVTSSSNNDLSSEHSWIMVDTLTHKNASLNTLPLKREPVKIQHNQFSIVLDEELHPHDSKALMKCAEVLSLLVRDAAHITPFNFDSCVHTIRVFVEASMHNATVAKKKSPPPKHKERKSRGRRSHGSSNKSAQSAPSRPSDTLGNPSADEDADKTAKQYHHLSLQLLELIHTLHTRASSIFHSWAEEQKSEGEEEAAEEICDAETSSLWRRCWCPLLQGIARLCTDLRTIVRSQALTYLQRALLVQDLNQLAAIEWEACFNKVLFPLLSTLLENPAIADLPGIEETRFRASTLLSKVYLTHLQALLDLSTFTALWLTILDFMDKYMNSDQSDQLMEGIPELLKNMLLVMGGVDIFYGGDSPKTETTLCRLTCDKLNTFLPALRREVFPVAESTPPQAMPAPAPSTLSTTAPHSQQPAAVALSTPVPQQPAAVALSTPIPQSAPETVQILPGVAEVKEAEANISSSKETSRTNSPVNGGPAETRATSPPSPQVRRPVSPEPVHDRSSSPLVHGLITPAFNNIKIFPPVAPPVSAAPKLVPVDPLPTPQLCNIPQSMTALPSGTSLLYSAASPLPTVTQAKTD